MTIMTYNVYRPSAPKPAPRAPLDKQSKDLANKRITAKAAPPRTAPPKVSYFLLYLLTYPIYLLYFNLIN